MAQGGKMIEINGTKWVPYGGALIPDVLPHTEITISEQDQRYLLRHSKTYFLRWTSDWDCSEATDFWYVIKDRPSDIEQFSSHTRRNIRRALRKFTIREVTPAQLADEGYRVYRQAFLRYRTYLKPITEAQFKAGFETIPSGFEYWAAFHGAKMVAYAINFISCDTCSYEALKLDPDYLKDDSSYGLLHTMNDHYLRSRKMRYLSNGARSLSHDTTMNQFLIDRFLFRKAYCRLHVVYAPRVALVVRLLYPFRHLVSRIETSPFTKIAVLLRHEEVRRSFVHGPAPLRLSEKSA
jgi:hypothetical protein